MIITEMGNTGKCLCLCYLLIVQDSVILARVFTMTGREEMIAPPGHSSTTARRSINQRKTKEAERTYSLWNELKTMELDMQLKSLQGRLRMTPAYGYIIDFIKNPGCDVTVPKNIMDLPGGIILGALTTSALLVAEGCPDPALTATRGMAQSLSKKLLDSKPIKDKSNCSNEAEEAVRMYLSEVPKLQDLYIVLAGGLYSATGCKSLAAKLLPGIVKQSYQISHVPMMMASFTEEVSDEDILAISMYDLNELQKEVNLRGMLPQANELRNTREVGGECESSWEKSVYKGVSWVPVVGSLWALGSAAAYYYKGCTEIATSRGSSALTSLAASAAEYLFG